MIRPLHLYALMNAAYDDMMITTVFTGCAAWGIVNRFMSEVGPMAPNAPSFRLASTAGAPLNCETLV